VAKRLERRAGIITLPASAMGHGGGLRFGAEGATAVVIDPASLNALATAEEIRKASGETLAVVCDPTDDRFARHTVAQAAASLGGPDVAWNHVGQPGPVAYEDMDMALCELAMNFNLRTPMLCGISICL